jgi:hypothetical protein
MCDPYADDDVIWVPGPSPAAANAALHLDFSIISAPPPPPLPIVPEHACIICLFAHDPDKVLALPCAHVVGRECWEKWCTVANKKHACCLCSTDSRHSDRTLEKTIADSAPVVITGSGRSVKVPRRLGDVRCTGDIDFKRFRLKRERTSSSSS